MIREREADQPLRSGIVGKSFALSDPGRCVPRPRAYTDLERRRKISKIVESVGLGRSASAIAERRPSAVGRPSQTAP